MLFSLPCPLPGFPERSWRQLLRRAASLQAPAGFTVRSGRVGSCLWTAMATPLLVKLPGWRVLGCVPGGALCVSGAHFWPSKVNQRISLTAVGAWSKRRKCWVPCPQSLEPNGLHQIASRGPVFSPPTCPTGRVCRTDCHGTPGDVLRPLCLGYVRIPWERHSVLFDQP